MSLKENADNKAFWNLYSGGINLMQEYMITESACEVQNLWTDEFLTNLEGVPAYKLPNMAFGQQGLLWTFLDNQLAPFVTERFGAGECHCQFVSNCFGIVVFREQLLEQFDRALNRLLGLLFSIVRH